MGVSRSKKSRRARRFRQAAARVVLALALCGRAAAHAQQAPGFEDLASQAAAARDQQNLPSAIDLYGKAVQARPDWAEGWWYLTLLQYSANQYSGAIDAANHDRAAAALLGKTDGAQ